mmetsp:Transcript_25598/g.60529  ORF Transcript_25598/g.60529 Transcript_25598/m.60529 type:complete len:113 (-) Transcript_25598:2583-2921(-)
MNRRNSRYLKCALCLLILAFLVDVHAFSVHQKRGVLDTSLPWTLLHLLSIDREDDPEEHDPTESSHDQFASSDYDPRRRHLLLQSTLVSILLQCPRSISTSAHAADMIQKTS